jgi:Fe-S cluster biogenesis protein NfuA
MTLYTEITPNPHSLKFVATHILWSGTADFPDYKSAENSPFAKALFDQFNYVKGVFFSNNFITITKSEDTQWEEIIPPLRQSIIELIEKKTVIALHTDIETVTLEDEVVQKIRQMIDEQVRPAVAMDGGDIIYEGFENGVVKLRLRGSCSGCPSSTFTLKAGIEALLTRMIPEVKAVEAV